MRSVLIIGAGASGLMAAFSAAAYGALVTVYEHNDIPGKKLLLTGNGKCNYTNTDIKAKHFNTENPGFLDTVLTRFQYKDCIDFFKKLGIEPEIKHYRFDDTGYVYPRDKNALFLRDTLYKACLEKGVKFKFRIPAEEQDIKKDQDGFFRLKFFPDEKYDAMIIATGSNAYPSTGSDSSIYPLLKKFNLGFKPFLPALCPLYSKDLRLKKLKGIRKDALVSLYIEGNKVKTYFGEVQFGKHYLSGIPVMQVSRFAAKALKEEKKCTLLVDEDSFEIYRTGSFDRAQCASGGIDTSLVDPYSMEVYKEKNIFICGELLDVDGECGGYNLHFAWATGYIAGKNAALLNK